MAAAVSVVAQTEQDTQGPAFQPEPAAVQGQGEAIPGPPSPHTPVLVLEHVTPEPLAPPTLAPAHVLPVAPTPNVSLNPNPDPNPAQSTLMGSLLGVIRFADDEALDNIAAEVPAGQNAQEPGIPLDHVMPNEVALPHAPFVQPLAPVQIVAAMVVQPFEPVANVANDNQMQPLLRSLRGIEGVQFEDQGREDY